MNTATATQTRSTSKTKQRGPHSGRSVLIAPNHRVNLAAAGHPLADYVPRTQLGRVALDLTMATSVSLITVAATTAYTFAVSELALPNVTFGQTPPPGIPIDPTSLQSAYNAFTTNLASLQGQTAAWMHFQPGTSTPSMFSQLTAIPSAFTDINAQVQAQFTILFNEQPGSPAYNNTLQGLVTNIGSQKGPITSLNTQMATLGTVLLNATDSLQTAATTGVLHKLYQAFQADISALETAIQNANSAISSDGNEIIGLGFAAAGAILFGVIGLGMIWNPLGWIMIGAGAVGAYFAINEILMLEAEISGLNHLIDSDTTWQTTYGQAAASVSSTITQIQGYVAMNAAAQEELTVLENLMTTLASDITTALNELNTGEISDALAEWNEIVAVAANLANVTAYAWPSPILLSDPTTFAAAGSDLYVVTSSAQGYYYAGTPAWDPLPDKTLSIVAAGNLVVGINGEPAISPGAAPAPAYTTDYLVKTFSAAANAWTPISTFPAAQIATDGTSIYAINQLQADRRVYKYSGTGTDWTPLPQFGTDAAQDIAIAGGMVFAILMQSKATAYWNGTGWNDLAMFSTALSGNGTKLGVIDITNRSWLYDTASNSIGNNGRQTSSGILRLAQCSNGDQYVIDTSLNLYYLNNQATPTVATLLKANAVGVAVSDTGAVYYSNNAGNSYVLVDVGSNAWTQLPSTPSAN